MIDYDKGLSVARKTRLVEIRENVSQNTLVVRHFGRLQQPSSVIHSLMKAAVGRRNV